METTRQTLRWAIPGFVFGLAAVCCWGGYLLLADLFQLNPRSEPPAVGSIELVMALVAGVPLGFVLYQAYYASYGPFFYQKWGWIRVDKGAWLLAPFSEQQLQRLCEVMNLPTSRHDMPGNSSVWSFHQLKGPFSVLRLRDSTENVQTASTETETTNGRAIWSPKPGSAISKEEYARRFHLNMELARTLIETIEERSDGTSNVHREYQTLSDLYHAMGAARLALDSGVALGLVWVLSKIDSGRSFFWWIGTATALFAFPCLAVAIHLLLGRSRTNVWWSLCNRMQAYFVRFYNSVCAA